MKATLPGTLRRIRTRTPNPPTDLFPDFFCIGPQRTGSTWLHTNLVRHPEILLHRDKETFYFSTLGEPGHPRFRYEFLEDYLESFRDTPKEWILKNYHALRRRGRAYSPRIIGESTASYCIIDEEIIAEIVAINPGLRAIMLLRDPMERAWSHAKKDLVRGASRKAGDAELLAFCCSEDQLRRADYQSIRATWQRHLQPGHFFVAPASRISADPVAFLHDVLVFLRAHDTSAPSQRHITTMQNPTSDDTIPDTIRGDLENALAPAMTGYRDLLAEVGRFRVY